MKQVFGEGGILAKGVRRDLFDFRSTARHPKNPTVKKLLPQVHLAGSVRGACGS